MGLLPVDTVFTADKSRTRVQGKVKAEPFAGVQLDGYEIHMGVSTVKGDPFCHLSNGKEDGCCKGNVFGTYLHGLFDTGELTETLIRWLAERKGIDPGEMTIIPHETYVQQQYDILAEEVRKVLDMDKIYEIMDRYEIADSIDNR
jgi:adenosylcobyric acid synthase